MDKSNFDEMFNNMSNLSDKEIGLFQSACQLLFQKGFLIKNRLQLDNFKIENNRIVDFVLANNKLFRNWVEVMGFELHIDKSKEYVYLKGTKSIQLSLDESDCILHLALIYYQQIELNKNRNYKNYVEICLNDLYVKMYDYLSKRYESKVSFGQWEKMLGRFKALNIISTKLVKEVNGKVDLINSKIWIFATIEGFVQIANATEIENKLSAY